MEKVRMWVYFSGEVHGVNTGWRVTEVEVGRKWVFLKTAGKRRHKVRHQIWEQMGKRQLDLTVEEQTTAQLKEEVKSQKETLDIKKAK